VSALFACNDQGFNPKATDTGIGEVGEEILGEAGIPETAGLLDEPVCYEFAYADSYHLDPADVRDGSEAGDFCTLRTNLEATHSEFGGLLRLGSHDIVGIEVLGFYTSVPPNESTLRVVGVADALAMSGAYPLTEHQYPSLGNFYSAALTADGDTSSFDFIEWFASGDAAESAGLSACTPDCVWEDIYLEIRDPVRALAGDCYDYIHETWVCFELEWADATGESTEDADCVAGSGRFLLAPLRRFDHDADGLATRVLAPVMVSGTGALTGAAWIQHVSVVAPPSTGALKVVHAQLNGLQFGPDDRITNAASAVTSLTAEGITFNETVSGTAPFVHERYVPSNDLLPMVDLQWTCHTLPADQVLPAPTGFAVTLASLGCFGDPAQKIILRAGMQAGEPMASVELYGAPRTRVRIPAVAVQGGLQLTYQRGGADIQAILRPNGPQGPTLDVQHAQFMGADVCDAGVVSLVSP
jgi:hypothetical protein